MKDFNPYSVLNIPDLSELDVIENAFLEHQEQFQNLPKVSAKQTQQFSRIQDAYDLLTHPTDKELIDHKLRQSVSANTNVRIEEPDDLLDESLKDLHSDDIEPELSREKNIEVSKPKKMNPFVSIGFMFGIFLAGSYIYGKFSDTQKEEVKAEQKAEPEVVQAPIQPTLISNDPTAIRNNVLYPDSSYLQQKEIIYAPDGSPFPMDAMVLPNLPNSGDGTSTIIVQNPHETAIFGKIVVRYSQTTTPTVNRYFYVPPKGTIHLFNMPSGSYQVLVMTLSNPKAFASPIFTIPIATDQTIVQLANWNFPFQASNLF